MSFFDLAILCLFVSALMSIFQWSEIMQVRRILARIEKSRPQQ